MTGWAPAARRIAALLLDAGRTRLALAATEIEEERLRLARQALCMAAGLFFLGTGLLAATLAWVMLAPAVEQPQRLAWSAAAYVSIGAAMVGAWFRLAARRRPLLQSTLDELQKDQAALMGAASGHAP